MLMYCLQQVGLASDEKLLELLELALSSKTAETVTKAREVMDSGVDPMILMSQMASLIMDVIVGPYFGGLSCECNPYFNLHMVFIFFTYINFGTEAAIDS